MARSSIFAWTMAALSGVCSSIFIMLPTVSKADRRIFPGASIPLSIPGKKPIAQILATCLREETLGSLYPSLSSVGPAPGTSAAETLRIGEDADRTGDELSWTIETKWLPALSHDLEFLEWKDASTSVQRFFSLDVSTSAYGPTYEETDLEVEFQTDAEGSDIDVALGLTGPLPYLRTEVVGRKTCSINEWGRELCAEEEEKTVVAQLIIPPQFVSAGTWVNRTTGHTTMKSFSYFRYAECLLWHWEN